MKQFIKDMFSNSDNVSSNRIAFITIILCVVILCVGWLFIAIKGTIWNIPTIQILDLLNILILGILGSGIVSKQVAKYFENKNEGEQK